VFARVLLARSQALHDFNIHQFYSRILEGIKTELADHSIVSKSRIFDL
jgi:hypothetical protein